MKEGDKMDKEELKIMIQRTVKVKDLVDSLSYGQARKSLNHMEKLIDYLCTILNHLEKIEQEEA